MSDDEQDDFSGQALLSQIDVQRNVIVQRNGIDLASKIPQKNGNTSGSLSYDVDSAIELHDCFNLLALVRRFSVLDY